MRVAGVSVEMETHYVYKWVSCGRIWKYYVTERLVTRDDEVVGWLAHGGMDLGELILASQVPHATRELRKVIREKGGLAG